MAGLAFRFGYSSNAYTRVSLEESIDRIAAAGFEAIEILADRPHVDPLRVSRRRIGRLRDRIRRSGLEVSNVNVNTNVALSRRDPEGFWPSLVDPDAGVRRRRIRYIEKALDFAAAVGSPCIAIAAGRAPRGESRAIVQDRFCRALEPVLRRADRRRVNVGIEYEPGHFIERADELGPVLRAVGHRRLGANLDIGHAACAGESVPAVIRRLRGRIWNLHFEDIRRRIHRHLVPGLGTLRFGPILRALRAIRYRGFITLELYPYKSRPDWAGRTGLEHLRRIAART